MSESQLYMTAPGADYLESFLLGNGRLGAIVPGGVCEERIALNHECLWRGLNRHAGQTRNVTAEQLEEIRAALFADDYLRGHDLCNLYLAGPANNPDGLSRIQPYQPLGDLHLSFSHENEIQDYERRLHLDDATAVVRYSAGGVEYTREFFVSQPHQVLMVCLRASAKQALNCNIWLNRIGDPQCMLTRRAEASTCGMTGRFVEGIEFAAEARVLTCDGCVSIDERSRRVRIENASEVIIAVAMAVDLDWPLPYSQPHPADWCAKHLATLPKSYHEIFTMHINEYRPLYNRFHFDLHGDVDLTAQPVDVRKERLIAGSADPGLFALYHNYARYLLLSSSRSCNLPANLQGIWNEELLPPWQCYFSTDINLSMNYWPAEAWGLPECVEPLFRYIEQHWDDARRSARDYYHCHGMHYFTGDIWQFSYMSCPNYDVWAGTTAMMAWHYFQRYEFSRDLQLLRDRIYPFLREAALFYSDLLVLCPDGHMVICPTQSPENSFIDGRVFPGEGPSYCYGATMDTQLVSEVLQHAIDSSLLLDIDSEERQYWQSILLKLPPLKTGRCGQLLEWYNEVEEFEPGHRHFSHLYGIFPGSKITKAKLPDAFRAADIALEYRLKNGENTQMGAGQTGWSRAWAVCLLARFRKAEQAYESLRRLLCDGTSVALLDTHPYPAAADRRPALSNRSKPVCFQIDGNMGGASGMLELLVQSIDGVIHLLPAVPFEWPSGNIQGMRLPGAITFDMTWENGKITKAVFRDVKSTPLLIELPEGTYLINGYITQVGKQLVELTPNTAKQVDIASVGC